jgi:hypothetical protein
MEQKLFSLFVLLLYFSFSSLNRLLLSLPGSSNFLPIPALFCLFEERKLSYIGQQAFSSS